MKTLEEWLSLSETTTLPTHSLVDGERVPAKSGAVFAVESPRDGSTLCEVPLMNEVDVDLAVGAARRAYEDGRWSGLPPKQRKQRMLKWAALIRKDVEHLALLETLDVGKPIGESYRVDVMGAATCIEWYAEAADKLYGEVANMGGDSHVTITREPLGVVGAVIPWNYPMLIASWKLGPSLVLGNSIVLKPAEQAPLSSIRLAELALEADIPDGVFNVVTGDGPITGRALGLHPDVDKLAFTGSTEVGKYFLQYSAQSNMKPVSLECGGKSPIIIMEDAVDLEAAAEAVAWAIFYNQGESCSAGSRLLVQNSIREHFIELVIDHSVQFKVGDPLSPDTNVGAIISRPQLDRITGYLDGARSQGARIRMGGTQERMDTGGYYLSPTIVDNVTPRMTIANEEVFGPVLSIMGFDSELDAVGLANDSIYGLAASIWTGSLGRAHRMSKAVRAGTVWVNTYDMTDVSLPFGGFKQSGFGRDKSLHALDGYSALKTTWMDLTV